jgi:MFS superfamily sulfate permease-like transporter
MAAAKMSENNGDETRREKEEEEEKRDESSEMNFMQRFHASRGFSDTPLCGLAYARDSFNFYKKNKLRLKNEILSGLTVSIAQVPESVAFSFVAKVDPLVGLYATFFLGIITALIGGRPGMVSGAAGAMAVVAVQIMEPNGLLPVEKLVSLGEISGCTEITASCKSLRDQAYDKRVEYLFMVMILCGILQIVLGLIQAGRLVRLIPNTVMTGFVNGLAIIIFKAQLESFQEVDWKKGFNVFDSNGAEEISSADITRVFAEELPDLSADQLNTYVDAILSEADADNSTTISLSEFKSNKDFIIHTGYEESKMWRSASEASTWIMLLYVFGSMFIVHYLPRVTKMVPSSLVSILSCLVFEHAINRTAIGADTPTVVDLSPVKGAFPTYHTPDVNLTTESFGIIAPLIFSLAAVGLIESVLTLQLVDEILEDTSDATGRCTQECVAQGVANLMSGMFKSMGGDAMIGQSTINVKSGGIGRLSTAFAATMFLIFVVAASKVIELVPVAALTGVLFMVVIYTFDWSCLSLMTGNVRSLCIPGRREGEDAQESDKHPAKNNTHRVDYAGRRRRKCFADTTDRVRLQDTFLILLVTILTERTNLAIATGTGVVFAALLYAWDNSFRALNVVRTIETLSDGTDRAVYRCSGELFFGTDRAFKNEFALRADPDDIVLNIDNCRVCDYSGLAAMNSLCDRYLALGKTLRVSNSNPENAIIIDTLGKKFIPAVFDSNEGVIPPLTAK